MPQPETIPTLLIDKVLFQAEATASHSWEYGIVFEAILEYQHPSLTVFHAPVSQHEKQLSGLIGQVQALRYIKPFIRTDSTTLCEGNGSSTDPASLGIPALFQHFTNPQTIYLPAVQRQIKHLLSITPRLPNGAISHREAFPSAWADCIYMVPPLLAYYGVYSSDDEMMREAVRQCQLYHELLVTPGGLWRHIANAGAPTPGERKTDDDGCWSTSNGWAAAGMARVLATLRNSGLAERMQDEQRVLMEMVEGIIKGTVEQDTDASGLLRNYLGDEVWWGEVAGTALLAAAVFRMAVMAPEVFGKYAGWAVEKMRVVSHNIDKETGIAAPVVNALNEGQRTSLDGTNPEGQAFVVLMYAAWQDWKMERTAT
ncbi:hypothetical protein SVAN01_04290 [Stagonosporopsis vannaccii]|nr:hypothetical protein SVAN01_04290 [Stagonosporopsis vannaccii]